jgi:hypothetical protein
VLHETGWIDQTLKKWKETENLQYVKQITALLNEELIKGSTDFSESYAYVISNPVVSLSDDLRNDSVLLKRFPLNLIVAVENSRSKILFQEYIQTCTVIDPSGMTINGNTDNSNKFSHPLVLSLAGNKRKTVLEESKDGHEDIYNLKVSLMIGNSYIDSKGQDTDTPYWINCDSNSLRRKGETYRHPNNTKRVMLRLRKNGCIFIFEKIGENSLLLSEIKVKIKILPDKYQGKTMPPNFYAELAKTPDSIIILKDSNQVEEFNKQLMNEATPIMIRKSVLWTFGMIGSTDYGVELLESHEVIEEIINIAENSSFLSVRGTALFSLSMICRCERGKVVLKNYKWYRADPQGITCLPSDHMKIFLKIDQNFEAGI